MAGNNLGSVTVQNNDRELICGNLGKLDFQFVRRAADGRVLTNCSAGDIWPVVAVSDRVDKLEIRFVVLQQRFKIIAVEVPLRVFRVVNNADIFQTGVATGNRNTPRKRTVPVVHVEEPAVLAEVHANADSRLNIDVNGLCLGELERLLLANLVLGQGQLCGSDHPTVPRGCAFSRIIKDDLDVAVRIPGTTANECARRRLHVEVEGHDRLSGLSRNLVLEVLAGVNLRAGRPLHLETNGRCDSETCLRGAVLISQLRVTDRHVGRDIGCGRGAACCNRGGGVIGKNLNSPDSTNR